MLLLLTLCIILLGKYFINYVCNYIVNCIYITYMRPLKIEDTHIAEEEQFLDDLYDNIDQLCRL